MTTLSPTCTCSSDSLPALLKVSGRLAGLVIGPVALMDETRLPLVAGDDWKVGATACCPINTREWRAAPHNARSANVLCSDTCGSC